MLRRRRESSVGRYASCKKLAIERLIGESSEKVIRGHSVRVRAPWVADGDTRGVMLGGKG